MKNPANLQFAVIVSQFNPEVTGGLLKGALETLSEHGVVRSNIQMFDAPGAFEIPLIAKKCAQTKKYDAIICLGCVIKGDTAHFEFISLGATQGLQQAILETETPMAFGILTTYTDEQALIRSKTSGDHAAHNKGREAALAMLGSLKALAQITQ